MMNAQEFYNHNKNCIQIVPQFPGDINNDEAVTNWVINQSGMGWLELDVEFDLELWKQESDHARFVNHRGDIHPGWNSCCIHGIEVDKTTNWDQYGYANEDEVEYKWTELSELTPSIKKFWEQFPYETYKRIRFMELEPGGVISPHNDLPPNSTVDLTHYGVPINVAIIHPEDCHMTLEGQGVVPWQEGKMFMINIRNTHSVINNSNQSRIHLIAHGSPGNRKQEFLKLVADSYRKAYEHSKI